MEFSTDDQKRRAAKFALKVAKAQEELNDYVDKTIGSIWLFDNDYLNDQRWPFTVEYLRKLELKADTSVPQIKF